MHIGDSNKNFVVTMLFRMISAGTSYGFGNTTDFDNNSQTRYSLKEHENTEYVHDSFLRKPQRTVQEAFNTS
jgi:hypothetical protein